MRCFRCVFPLNLDVWIIRIHEHADHGVFGTTSCRSSNRFAQRSESYLLTPVALPPGRLRLTTKPAANGSRATVNTMGITEVTALAASAAGVLVAAITVT